MNYPSSEVAEIASDEPIHERPILLLPGFTWDARANFGAMDSALQNLGYRTLAGHYYDSGDTPTRAFINGDEAKSRTEVMATQVLDEIARQGLENTPIDVVAFSYGSLIYDALVRQFRELELSAPSGNTNGRREAIFLAPSGTIDDETAPRLTVRYAAQLGSLAADAHFNRGIRAQARNPLKHPITRLREAAELGSRQVDYQHLSDIGINVHVIGYHSDSVFPHHRLQAGLEKQPHASYSELAIGGAVHGSPLLHPYENALAIDTILRSHDPNRVPTYWPEA